MGSKHVRQKKRKERRNQEMKNRTTMMKRKEELKNGQKKEGAQGINEGHQKGRS